MLNWQCLCVYQCQYLFVCDYGRVLVVMFAYVLLQEMLKILTVTVPSKPFFEIHHAFAESIRRYITTDDGDPLPHVFRYFWKILNGDVFQVTPKKEIGRCRVRGTGWPNYGSTTIDPSIWNTFVQEIVDCTNLVRSGFRMDFVRIQMEPKINVLVKNKTNV